ncbi:MAG: hypothetical protein U9R56_04840, partial [candidate division Zixibacteria bacterium]|nr:hypothetical protein [candidate division Zixibacteria bacterium]
MKRLMIIFPVLVFLLFANSGMTTDAQVAGKCMTCHKEKSPGLYQQWFMSQHAVHKVTCIDCHGAQN